MSAGVLSNPPGLLQEESQRELSGGHHVSEVIDNDVNMWPVDVSYLHQLVNLTKLNPKLLHRSSKWRGD